MAALFITAKALHTEKEIPSPYKRASIYKILGKRTMKKTMKSNHYNIETPCQS